MEDAMINLMWLMAFVVLTAPLLSMVWMTIRRFHKFPNTGRTLKLQYHISDMLVASFLLPLAILFFQFIFKDAHGSFFVTYFVLAACFGAIIGKVWHLTTIDNTWRNGPTYMLVGSALWTIASIGPIFSFIIIYFALRGMPNC